MKIEVVTLFPESVQALLQFGVTGRAVERGLLQVGTSNPRDHATDKHKTVDDRPYGGGPGMVMKVETLRAAIRAAREKAGAGAKVIYLSPQGRKLDQAAVRELMREPALVLVAGRYEGVDERLLETEVDEEWSIGDYVLSGGELPALGAEVDHLRSLAGPGLRFADGRAQSLDLHHHPGTAAVRPVVHGLVLVGGVVARVGSPYLQQTALHRASRHTELQESLDTLREQRDDFYMHTCLVKNPDPSPP